MVSRQELEKLRKQKIVLVGPSGTGKTYTAVQVAKTVSKKGKKVYYIDPEYGSEEELVKLSDDELKNIELVIPTNYEKFVNAVDNIPKDASLVIVDGLSEIVNFRKLQIQKLLLTEGFFVDGKDEIQEIKSPETFTIPGRIYARIYLDLSSILYDLISLPDIHVLMCMHPMERQARGEVQEGIFRKADLVIQLTKTIEDNKPKWYGKVIKNRGKETETSEQVYANPWMGLVKRFEQIIR